jgi:hypothetical protein
VEVAARGSGALTPAGSGEEREGRTASRVNRTLALLTAVALVAACGGAWLMHHTYHNRADAVDGVGLWSVITIERDEGAALSSRGGEDVGPGTVEAMKLAPQVEQARAADQIEAATKMANAFLNLSHDDIEANVAAVRSLATGPFLRQWDKATTSDRGLIALIKRAKATQVGEVSWAGLVAGDEDSATVIVATTGTVANKLTEFEAVARTYRLQLELALVDGQWLTSDLQYVR